MAYIIYTDSDIDDIVKIYVVKSEFVVGRNKFKSECIDFYHKFGFDTKYFVFLLVGSYHGIKVSCFKKLEIGSGFSMLMGDAVLILPVMIYFLLNLVNNKRYDILSDVLEPLFDNCRIDEDAGIVHSWVC